MKIQRFEDIVAWQKAQELAVSVYNVFGTLKDWGFRNQICEASVSISNNIAEGFDRSSKADFKRFLYIALGSASEVKSMIYLAEKLKFITPDTTSVLLNGVTEVSKTITGLIKYLQKVIDKLPDNTSSITDH